MLLGSSSAEQFLLVLAEEEIPRAQEFLTLVADALTEMSGGTLRLLWSSTENLGAWPVARKRLDDDMLAKTTAPLANKSDLAILFAPFTDFGRDSGSYFVSFAEKLSSAATIGWSKSNPALLTCDEGDYRWPLVEQSSPEGDGISFPRRFALDDAGQPASPAELGNRAEGASRWGILRGDVDQFDVQLKRATTIEEHIHLSVLFKEFIAGELSLLCTLPDFWRKVTLLYRGGEDFIVTGSWDALLLLARELQRLFEKFAEQNLQTLPGLEGKTMSMALALAPDLSSPVSAVMSEALQLLEQAKAVEQGTFNLFGRPLEWKRFADAEELKQSLVRLVYEFGYSPACVHDLASVYRETSSGRFARRKSARADKPWRTYRRLSQVIPQARGKDVNNVRTAVINSLIGKRTAALKLRPSARVGLEWARLSTGSQL